MKKNMGTTDKLIRVFLAIVILALILKGVLTGTAAVILGIFAAAFVLSSMLGFCPLYAPFKINTTRRNLKDTDPDKERGDETVGGEEE